MTRTRLTKILDLDKLEERTRLTRSEIASIGAKAMWARRKEKLRQADEILSKRSQSRISILEEKIQRIEQELGLG